MSGRPNGDPAAICGQADDDGAVKAELVRDAEWHRDAPLGVHRPDGCLWAGGAQLPELAAERGDDLRAVEPLEFDKLAHPQAGAGVEPADCRPPPCCPQRDDRREHPQIERSGPITQGTRRHWPTAWGTSAHRELQSRYLNTEFLGI